MSHVVVRSSGLVFLATMLLVPGYSINRRKNSAHPPEVLPLPHPPQKPLYFPAIPWNSACLGLGSYGTCTSTVRRPLWSTVTLLRGGSWTTVPTVVIPASSFR